MERVSDFKDVLPPFIWRREQKRTSSEETLRQQRVSLPPPVLWMQEERETRLVWWLEWLIMGEVRRRCGGAGRETWQRQEEGEIADLPYFNNAAHPADFKSNWYRISTLCTVGCFFLQSAKNSSRILFFSDFWPPSWLNAGKIRIMTWETDATWHVLLLWQHSGMTHMATEQSHSHGLEVWARWALKGTVQVFYPGCMRYRASAGSSRVCSFFIIYESKQSVIWC